MRKEDGLDLTLGLVLLHYCQLDWVELVFCRVELLDKLNINVKIVRSTETPTICRGVSPLTYDIHSSSSMVGSSV